MKEYILSFVPLLSLIILAVTFIRTSKKDDKEETEKTESRFEGLKSSIMKVDIKLDQVFVATNEMRTDVKTLNKDMMEIDRRLCVAETDIKNIKQDIASR